MPDKYIRQIQVTDSYDSRHELAAKYIQGDDSTAKSNISGLKTWGDILELFETSFDLYVWPSGAAFPPHNPPTKDDYTDYHNKIVLVADQAATGQYIEWVITQSGDESFAWEQIGSTEVDLSNYVQKGTYTTGEAGSGYTGYADAATVTTTSGGDQTATGTATVTVPSITLAATPGSKPWQLETGATGAAGKHTINGSNFSFNGTKATINNVKVSAVNLSADAITFTPSGSIGGSQDIAAHSHGVNAKTAAITYVIGATLNSSGAHSHDVNLETDSVTVQNLTKAISAGGHTHAVNADTIAITYLSGGSIASDGAHTHDVTKTTGTATYVTGGTISSDGSHSHTVSLTTVSIPYWESLNTKSADHTHDLDIRNIISYIHPASVIQTVSPTTASVTYVNAPASLSASSNWGFATANTSVMKTATVTNNGVLSWEVVLAGSQASVTYTPATTATLNYVSSVTTNDITVLSNEAYSSSAYTLTITGGGHTHEVGGSGGRQTVVTNVTVNSVGAHSHTFNKATASSTFLTDVSVNSAGAHSHTFNGTQATATVMTGATLGTAGAHTHALDGTSKTVNFVTGATLASAGGHSHAVNIAQATATFMTSATLATAGAVTVQGSNFSFTGSKMTITPSVTATLSYTPFEFTPAGTIGGSQTIDAHTHSYDIIAQIDIPAQTATGTAAVAVTAHTHNVTIPTHRHSVGNHTHSVDLN